MSYLNNDLFAAWAEGGLRAYCHLDAARRFAWAARDYKASADLDFLEDVMNERMLTELTQAAA